MQNPKEEKCPVCAGKVRYYPSSITYSPDTFDNVYTDTICAMKCEGYKVIRRFKGLITEDQ